MAPDRRQRAARRLRWWWLPATVITAGVLYYGVTLAQVWWAGRGAEPRAADAIVVLGAAQYDGRPSPQLAARLDEVLRLWPEGWAEWVVVTGGSQPGDRFTEAEASQRYLTERGVPADAILLENAGTTTYESLVGVAGLLAADDGAAVLLVTDPFHALRSRLIAEELGLRAQVIPTSTSVVGGAESVRLHLREALGVAAGRIIGFERLGEITG